jgi:hypothetical protein
MRRAPLILVLIGVALATKPAAGHTVAYVQTLNASCHLAAPTVCKLRVEPYTVGTFFGARLEAFQLQANGETLYDFRTDVSNPPAGTYTPSRVRLDFAATCGGAYVVSLLADDTSQAGLTLVGQTEAVPCPQGRAEVHLPLIMR